MIIAAVMLFFGCQEEYIQVTEPDKIAVFSTGDTLAESILRVTMKDGSFDDIIDNCSDISINFPYTIQIKNKVITIDSQEDIELIYQTYAQSTDAINIKFPVTITFSDHSEMDLYNRGDLQKLQLQFPGNKEDEIIKCIDFIYPFDINLYDRQFQKPEFVSVGSDKEMHGLLKKTNDILFEIGYPIFIELFDGTLLKIENNRELEMEILQAIGTCDNEAEFDV